MGSVGIMYIAGPMVDIEKLAGLGHGGRVTPANCSAEVLARSVRGRFDHTAPLLIRLMGRSKGSRTPSVGEAGNPTIGH